MSPTLVAYVSVAFILAVTPGATTALVIRNTLERGWRGGLLTAVGAATANSTYATLAAVGLAVFITHSPTTLKVLRVAGALYLMWLGGRGLLKALRPNGQPRVGTRSANPGFGPLVQGLLTNLLNPPIITFYLVVVPTFLPPGGGTADFAWLAAIHVLIAFGCHLAWATAFDRIGHLLSGPIAKRSLDAAAAVAILVLAARVLMT
jgi:threonine/homoserine/homoserine lactone efflux protein